MSVKKRLAGTDAAGLEVVALERSSRPGQDGVGVGLERRLRLLAGLLQEIHFFPGKLIEHKKCFFFVSILVLGLDVTEVKLQINF